MSVRILKQFKLTSSKCWNKFNGQFNLQTHDYNEDAPIKTHTRISFVDGRSVMFKLISE